MSPKKKEGGWGQASSWLQLPSKYLNQKTRNNREWAAESQARKCILRSIYWYILCRGVCVPDLTGDVSDLKLEPVAKLKAPEGCHGLGWLSRDHAPYRSRRHAAGSHVSSSPLSGRSGRTNGTGGWLVYTRQGEQDSINSSSCVTRKRPRSWEKRGGGEQASVPEGG